MPQLGLSVLRNENGWWHVLPIVLSMCLDLTPCPVRMFAVSNGMTELRTMVQERWASPQVPVLILSCIPTATSLRLPAVDVVEALELSSFSRPWMVSSLCVLPTSYI